jgi:hypothetical protein
VTIGIPQRSVLVVGASQRVLDDTVAALRDLGYTAQATNDFTSDITGRFDVTKIDLVTLGGQIPTDGKAELKDQIGATNPRVRRSRPTARTPTGRPPTRPATTRSG